MDRDSLTTLVASIERLDVLVNNAGGNLMDCGEAGDRNPEVFAETLRLHVGSAFQLVIGCRPMLSRSAIAGG